VILEGEIGPWGPTVLLEVRAAGGGRVERGLAIMDSGARLSVVDAGIAAGLGADVVGSHLAKGVCGSCEMKKYRVELTIGGVAFSDAVLLGKQDLAPQFIALLGQDFLSLGILHCDGPARRYRFSTP
jgi:hypothetical protein